MIDKMYRDHHRQMLNLARRMVGEDAEDVVQDVFLRAFRSEFRGDCAPSTWLHRITVNQCLYTLKRRKRLTSTLGHPVDTDALDEHESHERTPEQEYGVQELLTNVSRAWELMRPECKEVMTLLHELDGYQEIADHLGIPIGTVRSRIFRGREILKGETI